tara:strand:+ start:21914 stop:22621 length:708 start_codon:yes stop_codon:yes gene_type:complete
MITHRQLTYGNFLFKYRGILPVPIILLSFISFYYSDTQQISLQHYLFSLSVSISGLIIRVLSVGYAFHKTSGKNTKKQIAENLNTTGIYSLLRNPLYFANYLNWLGIILLLSDIFLTIIITLFFTHIYYYIIIVEENFLRDKFKSEYEKYINETPRIFPSFKNWKPPKNKFNLIKSLINIKNGMLGISIIFYLISTVDKYKYSGEFYIFGWLSYLLLFSILFYLSIKLILMVYKK